MVTLVYFHKMMSWKIERSSDARVEIESAARTARRVHVERAREAAFGGGEASVCHRMHRTGRSP